MGLFSWPATSSSSSRPVPPAPAPPPPAVSEPTPAATSSTDPSSSLPSPPRKPRRRRRRDQIPSNGPTYIFTTAGIAFTVGLLISVRQVRKLKVAASELSRKAALAEGSALPARLTLALGGGATEVPKVKRVGTSSILSPGGGGAAGVLSIPIAKGTWALTPPPTFLPPPSKFTKIEPTSASPSSIQPPQTTLPSPSPLKINVAPPSSPSSPAPLFPPSKTRPIIPIRTPPLPSPLSSSPLPPSTLLDLLKAGNAPDPEDPPPPPPSDPKVILYGFGALGIATVIAMTVVALPAAAFCWWLGVEKPSQFRPLLELKLPGLIPSLPPSLVRRVAPNSDPNSPNPSPLPSQLHWAKDEDWEEDDEGEEGDEEFLGDEGTWGEWWGRVKEEFEEDRREEEERKRRSVVEVLGR